MSKIRFTCPHCNNPLTLPESVAGKAGRCPRCGEAIDVPETSSQPDSTDKQKKSKPKTSKTKPAGESEPTGDIPEKPNWFGRAGDSEKESDAPEEISGWHLKIGGQVSGPISEEEFRQMLADGKLRPGSQVRCDQDDWQDVADLPEFQQTEVIEPADDEPSEQPESADIAPSTQVTAPERSPGLLEAHARGVLQWYVFNGQQDVGPMSVEHLLEGVARRHVQPGHLVTKDLKTWVRAAEIDWLNFPNPLMP